MKTPILTALSIATVLAAFTSCQTTTSNNASPSGDRFAAADANHDGKLSEQEASDYFVGRIFESRDYNHDGKVTWAEWHVPGSNESKAKFDAADLDKDGALSRSEALAYGRRHGLYKKEFREADTNHDGFVTREEAKAYYASKEGSPR